MWYCYKADPTVYVYYGQINPKDLWGKNSFWAPVTQPHQIVNSVSEMTSKILKLHFDIALQDKTLKSFYKARRT